MVVNQTVPSFSAMSSSGQLVNLSEFVGKKVILYFYPKDNTPGCTLEGQEFNQLLNQFNECNAVVFGVSRDTVKSHCQFIAKYNYQFELLSDEDEKLCQLFQVIKEKNMYGKKVMGIERSTFIIDENQKLMAEFRKVSAPGHAQDMLNYIKNNK